MSQKIIASERGDATTAMLVSLNMILLAFFIAMTAFAVVDTHRQRKAWGSFLGSLGILSGGLNPGGSTKGQDRELSGYLVEMQKSKGLITFLLQSIEEFAVNKKLTGNIGYYEIPDGAYITVTNQTAFNQGGDELSESAKELIDKMSVVASKTSSEISIIGNAALGEYKNGLFPDDTALSIARAGEVARYLIEKCHVIQSEISVSGYGASRPITDSRTDEQKRLNNRLELKMHLPKEM